MKPLLAGILLLVACKDDVEMFPVSPGGGGSTSGTNNPDAAIDANGDAGNTIAGRVCVLQDARAPTDCADTGADNLTVTLGAFTATTEADGSFTITRPGGTNQFWRVSGAQIDPAAMSFGTLNTIPALRAGLLEEMLGASDAIQVLGDGSIIAQVKRGTTPVSMLTATSTPVPDGEVYFYDGTSAQTWGRDATGPAGMIWVPGVTAGPAQVDVTDGTTDTPLTGITVFADTVTFVFAEIP